MKNPLIINQSRSLPLYQRIYSNAMTIALWLLWIVLWLPIFKKLQAVILSGTDFDDDLVIILDSITPVSLPHVFFAVIGTSSVLLLFSLLPSRKVHATHLSYSQQDYAHFFKIDEANLALAQQARVCTVHHDENGLITALENNK